MKILIVNYYGIKKPFDSIINSFENNDCDISVYPLLQYYADVNDKKEDYVDHFCSFINKNEPDVILWWYISIPINDMEYISNKFKNIHQIFYSWDDPFIWDIKDNTHINLKAKFFDDVFISCTETIPHYKENGTTNAYCLYPGFDPKINFPKNDIDYKYDISFCISNLYIGDIYNDQYIPRKQLIDDIYNENDINFAIFGPEYLKDIYPNSYKGFVQYENLNDVFNSSRINISLHVCNSKKGYMNERVSLVLASGGLLLTDPIDDTPIKNGENVIYLEKYNYIDQIKNILNNYSDFLYIKHNGYNFSKNYNWDNWVKFIISKIPQKIKIKKSSLSIPNNINGLQYIEILNIFQNIFTSKNIDEIEEYLFLLNTQTEQNINIDVNKILYNFFEII